MAAEDVRELMIRINASTELLRSNLTAAERAVANFERDTNAKLAKVDSDFGRLGGGLDRLKTGFASLTGSAGGFIAAIGVGTVVAAGRAVLEFGDNLEAAADQAGISVERYQTLREGLRTLELSTEQTDQIFNRLNDTLGSVQAGTASKELVGALDRLGVSQGIVNGTIRDAGDLLDGIAAGAKRYSSDAQFAADVTDVFGRKVGIDLAAALRDGGVALKQAEADMRSAGNVLSKETVERLADANETIDKFFSNMRQNAALWAADIIEAAQQVGDALTGTVRLDDGIGDIGTRVTTISKKLATFRKELNSISYAGGRGPALRRAELKRLIDDGERDIDALTQQGRREVRTFELGQVPTKRSDSNTKTIPKKIDDDAQLAIKSVGQLAGELSKLDIKSLIRDGAGKSYQDITGVDAADGFEKMMAAIEKPKDDAFAAWNEAMDKFAANGEEKVRSLTDLFQTGMERGSKGVWADFKRQGEAVIAQVLARFVVQNIFGRNGGGSSLDSIFSSAIGSVFGGGFADGGDLPMGKVSMVGERGPELVVPKVPSTVIPNHALGGQTNLSMTINAPGATAETVAMIRRELAQAAPVIVRASQQSTMRAMTRPRM